MEAAIRQMVGGLYTDLGEPSKALRHLEAALDVQRRELGEKDPQTLATMHHLGTASIAGTAGGTGVLGRTLELPPQRPGGRS